MSRQRAMVRAMSVLPRPGTPSMRTWPRQSRAVSSAARTVSWPTTTRPISALSLVRAAPGRRTAAASSGLGARLAAGCSMKRSGAGLFVVGLVVFQRQERAGGEGPVGGGLLAAGVAGDDRRLGAAAAAGVVELGVLGGDAL